MAPLPYNKDRLSQRFRIVTTARQHGHVKFLGWRARIAVRSLAASFTWGISSQRAADALLCVHIITDKPTREQGANIRINLQRQLQGAELAMVRLIVLDANMALILVWRQSSSRFFATCRVRYHNR